MRYRNVKMEPYKRKNIILMKHLYGSKFFFDFLFGYKIVNWRPETLNYGLNIKLYFKEYF